MLSIGWLGPIYKLSTILGNP